MTISANRFNVTDSDIKSPVMDFLKIKTNDNYNATPVPNTPDGPGTTSETIGDTDILDQVSTAGSELIDKLTEGESISDVVTEEVEEIFENIGDNEDIPPIIKDAADKAKGTDLDAAVAKVSEELSKPPMELCGNTGFLDTSTFGSTNGLDLIESFLGAALIEILDKICEEVNEVLDSDPVNAIETIVGVANGDVTVDNALGKLGTIADAIDTISSSLPEGTPPTTSSLIDDILSGNVSEAIEAIRESNPDSATKQSYIEAIELEEEEVIPGSTEHLALLEAKGIIKTLPVTSTASREHYIVNQHITTGVARDLKAIGDLDTSKLPVTNDPVRKSIYSKLGNISMAVKNNTDLQSRPNTPNEYDDFDFGSIDLTFTHDELELLGQEATKIPPSYHKRSDLSVSTESYLEDF